MEQEVIVMMARRRLKPSPFQPRTQYHRAELEEMAETMKPPGRIHSPIVARELEQTDVEADHEIVFGHKRWFSSEIAGLDDVPVIVRKMTDEEVKVAQIVENLQRSGVSPMDEAEAMLKLRNDHDASIEQLMQHCGKGRSYVYNRLKLAQAHTKVREAVAGGVLDAEVASEIARVPLSLQPRAMQETRGMSYRAAKDLLQHRFQLKLSSAPFNTFSTVLLHGVVACDACPKRSDAEPVLEQECGPGVCMDPDCYGKKASVAADIRRREEAKAAKKAAEAAKKVAAAPVIAPTRPQLAQAWPFPSKPPKGWANATDSEPDDDDDTPSSAPLAGLTPEEQEVTRHDRWMGIKFCITKRAMQMPRTTDDLRAIATAMFELYDTLPANVIDAMGWTEEYEETGHEDMPQWFQGKLAALSADELGGLLIAMALDLAPFGHRDTSQEVRAAKLALAKRYGVDVLDPSACLEEPSAPSTAAQAPGEAAAEAGSGKKTKKAKGKKAALVDQGSLPLEGEEQTIDAGSAGGSDAGEGALEEAAS